MSRVSIWDILAGHRPKPVTRLDWHRFFTRQVLDARIDSIMAESPDALAMDDIPRRALELEDLELDGDSLEMHEEGVRNEWPIEAVPRRAPGPIASDAEMPTLKAPMKGKRRKTG